MAGTTGWAVVTAALPLPWPFDRPYMQVALLAAVVVGACAPLVGAFLVSRRLALLGDGIGHVAFAGVAGGLLVGVWPLAAALVVSVSCAMGLEWLRSHRSTSSDLALAALFYSGIAGGVVLAQEAGALNGSALRYLFGSILTVSASEAAAIVGVGVVIVACVGLAWRQLLAVVLDEEGSRVAGLPVDALNLGLAALAAVTVVAGMRVVGVLLVAALMVLPVGTAQRVAGSFRGMLVIAAAAGVAAAVLGLAAARAFGLAPGGTIVLVAVAMFLVANVAGPRGR